MKKWEILKADKNAAREILNKSNLSPLCAEILTARGFDTVQKAAEFFGSNTLSDPFLLKDMDKGVEIINNAIENDENICIYGDYDCDGIMSTVILYSYLEALGANISYYIPERSEGYGLNNNAIKSLYDSGVQLIITVDNGISANAEIDYAKSLGMKVLVTDHHNVPDVLPNADAIIDPKQPDCNSPCKVLCGAGVALKLTAALDGGDYSMVEEQFSDLAAIATVADIVDLTGENRAIVNNGLHYITNTENLGLSALINAVDIDSQNITSTQIAFILAPRINASGRFGSPKTAAKMLLCDDEEEAERLAQELCTLNQQRKDTESEIMEQIQQMIDADPSLVEKRVLVFAHEGWHKGVIGIISARLTERFGKPSYVISIDGEEARGSARGVEGYSVYDALYATSRNYTNYGGHTGAGGFGLKTENLEQFRADIEEHARCVYRTMPVSTEYADKLLLPQDITIENVRSLSALEPFGKENKLPVFAVVGAKILEIKALGQEGKHTKIRVDYGGALMDVLFFRTVASDMGVSVGDNIDILVNLDINEFRGRISISVKAVDYRCHGINQPKYFAAKEAYEKFKRGEDMMPVYYQRLLPTREEMLTVYKNVGEKEKSIDTLFHMVNSDDMNFGKFKISLDVLEELELIKCNHFTATAFKGTFKKVNLDDSTVLKKIKEKCN